MATRWNVAAGNFLFRYRNALFPLIIALLLVATRPHPLFQTETAQGLWIALGVALAILGEAIRLLTIGYDYIDRGGKKGSVYASRLVQGGVYAHVRNPMYLGNILIAAGLIIFSGSPLALVTALPFFLYAYIAIVAAEEVYLRKSFGEDYQAYCAAVPSFLPRWTGLRRRLAALSYDWKRALRKDYGNMYLIAMSFILLSWRRVYFLNGEGLAWELVQPTLWAILISTVVYFAVMRLKKIRALG